MVSTSGSAVATTLWQVVLLYRGFRTASGLRGFRCAGAAIVAILAAEVLSKAALWAIGRIG